MAPIHVLLRTMDTFVTPILARTYDQSGTPKLKRTLNLIFLRRIPVIGLLIVAVTLTPRCCTCFKGETYLPYANGILSDMALFYFFMFINRPLQMVFRAIRHGKQVFTNILAAVSMFTVGVWLINQWGFMAQLPVRR